MMRRPGRIAAFGTLGGVLVAGAGAGWMGMGHLQREAADRLKDLAGYAFVVTDETLFARGTWQAPEKDRVTPVASVLACTRADGHCHLLVGRGAQPLTTRVRAGYVQAWDEERIQVVVPGKEPGMECGELVIGVERKSGTVTAKAICRGEERELRLGEAAAGG